MREVTLTKINTRTSYAVVFALRHGRFITLKKLETKHYYRGDDGELYTFTEVHMKPVNTYKEELDGKKILIKGEKVVEHRHFGMSPEHYPYNYEEAL